MTFSRRRNCSLTAFNVGVWILKPSFDSFIENIFFTFHTIQSILFTIKLKHLFQKLNYLDEHNQWNRTVFGFIRISLLFSFYSFYYFFTFLYYNYEFKFYENVVIRERMPNIERKTGPRHDWYNPTLYQDTI